MPDFGISEALIPLLTGVVGEGAAGAIAPIAAGIGEGAAGGALFSGITGGDVGKGALTGAITGGAIPAVGPALGAATGIGTTAGDALAGAAAGAAGSAITGGSPGFGALTGGAAGAASGVFGGSGSSSPSSAAPTIGSSPSAGAGGGTSPISTTAGITPPAGATQVDLTSNNFGDFSARPGAAATAGISTPAAPQGDFSARPAGDFGSKILGSIERNPGLLLSAAPLAMGLFGGGQAPSGAEKALQQSAGEAGTVARTLEAYQISGTLPPGLQSVVDLHSNEAEAGLKSKYAQLGLSGSTMEVQALGQLKQEKSGQIAQLADNLAKQGIAWENLSASELSQLVHAQEVRDTNFQNALGTFARGLAGASFGGTGGGSSGGSSGAA